MRTVAKKPVLKHLSFNAARPGAARESCRCLRNALLVRAVLSLPSALLPQAAGSTGAPRQAPETRAPAGHKARGLERKMPHAARSAQPHAAGCTSARTGQSERETSEDGDVVLVAVVLSPKPSVAIQAFASFFHIFSTCTMPSVQPHVLQREGRRRRPGAGGGEAAEQQRCRGRERVADKGEERRDLTI